MTSFWLLMAVPVIIVSTAFTQEGTTDQVLNSMLETSSPTYVLRGGLDNSRLHFLQHKEGRVAFIGGSITAKTPGWTHLTSELLKQRFPDTHFDFVYAGLGGTNSSLGAFRLAEDVFGDGPVDLLFVEFACNDGSAAKAQRERGMEGIIRHARRINPNIDIVIQYMADQNKMADIQSGKIPEIIAEHDRVAAYYQIPVIVQAFAVARQLSAGAFTWEECFRDHVHPQERGHQFYAGQINAFLDAAWAHPADPNAEAVTHTLPAPLDPLNYGFAQLVTPKQTDESKGWRFEEGWKPDLSNFVGKRFAEGKADVLVAEAPGSKLTFRFKGPLVGLFALSGKNTGELQYQIDGSEPKIIQFYDEFSPKFYRAVCQLLADDLSPGEHVLTLTVAESKNPESLGNTARLLKFIANGEE